MLTNGIPSARIGNAVGTAGVAQLVEQLICNQQAGGSSPSTSSKTSYVSGGIPERSNGADCKSVVTDFGGSNPPSPTSSEIPLTAALPARRAESSAGRGISSLSPANRVAGFAGDFLRGRIAALAAREGELSPDGWFLRFCLRTALLGSQVIFLRGRDAALAARRRAELQGNWR